MNPLPIVLIGSLALIAGCATQAPTQLEIAAPVQAPQKKSLYDTPPERIHTPAPIYRSTMRPEATVVISYRINTDGTTSDLRVVETTDSVAATITLRAIEQWRFKPAMKDGQPVARRFVQKIEFGRAPGESPENIFILQPIPTMRGPSDARW